ATFGPELDILCETDVADLSRAGGSLLGEAVARLRNGEVIKEAGYDGEYGVIRLFRPEELAETEALFDVPAPAAGQGELLGVPAPAASGEELLGVPAPTVSEEAPPGAPTMTGP